MAIVASTTLAALFCQTARLDAAEGYDWLRPPEPKWETDLSPPAPTVEPTPSESAIWPRHTFAWAKALSDPDSAAAAAALDQMSAIGRGWEYSEKLGPQEVCHLNAALIRGLAAKQPTVRLRCLGLISNPAGDPDLGETAEVLAVVDCLQDTDVEVRLAATTWLMSAIVNWAKQPRAKVALLAAAQRLDYEHREYAVETIATLGAALQIPKQRSCWGPPIILDPTPTPDDVWLQYACFVDAPLREVRRHAFLALAEAEFVPLEMFPAAVRGIRDADPELRYAAVWYLTSLLHVHRRHLPESTLQEVWAQIRPHFQQQDRSSQWWLCRCIGAMGPAAREATPTLLDMMRRPKEQPTDYLPECAAKCLAAIDDRPEVIQMVVDDLLKRGPRYFAPATAYFTALPPARLTAASGVDVGLGILLHEAEASLRLCVVEHVLAGELPALRGVALRQAEEAVIRIAVRGDDCQGLIQAVARCGVRHDDARESLRHLIFHRRPEVRLATLESLEQTFPDSELGLRRFEADLAVVAEHDRYGDLRDQAGRLLAAWRNRLSTEVRPAAIP